MGPLELGGRYTSLQRGSLAVSEPRELLVGRQYAHAFEPDGTIARDTLCFRGEAAPGRDQQKVLGEERETHLDEVVDVHEEEVLWGGQIASHFGHFLCESVARLWPLLPGAELEGMPVVFTTEAGRPLPRELPFVREWLDAFGARQVELPERGTVRFAKLRVPETAWRLGAWIAPEIRDVHLHARRKLNVGTPPQRDVLWLSRQRLNRVRTPYDEALLEWLLGDRIVLVYPETMSLAEQVAAFEGSRAAVGAIGSAFHSLLMADDPPECLFLCPPWDKELFSAQQRLIDTTTQFAQALAVAAWAPSARRRGVVFPFGYRMLVPEALATLGATVLPELREDPRMEAFANPAAHWAGDGAHAAEDDLDTLVAKVLLDPLSVGARMALGDRFEAEGLERCALEQFTIVADLVDDNADAPLRAARILARESRTDEAAQLAQQVLAIDSGSAEAIGYADAGPKVNRVAQLLMT